MEREQLLRDACRVGDLQRVQELHGQGVQLTAASNSGGQPIHWAAQGGHLPVVQWLHGQGEPLTAASNNASQPIHWAAQNGHLPVVQWLHGQGVPLTVASNGGLQLIHFFAQARYLPVVQWLLGQGVDFAGAKASAHTAAAMSRLVGHIAVADWLDAVFSAPPAPSPEHPLAQHDEERRAKRQRIVGGAGSSSMACPR